MIVAGALIVSLIALSLDYLMGRIERIIISPGLRFHSGESYRGSA
jgi:ABC-type proline/glycine betaine transport system permease subunit